MMLKNPVLTPDVAETPDVFQRKCESQAALDAHAKVHLHPFETQAVAIEIIANLCDRLLENRTLDVVRDAQAKTQAPLEFVAILHIGAQLIAGELNRTAVPEEICDIR